jgi:hypothetical protein
MEDGRAPTGKESDAPPAETLDDFTAALMQTPQAYEVFVRLSPQEQLGLMEWVNAGANPRNRERRLRTICAVLARSGTEWGSLKDALWVDGHRIGDRDQKRAPRRDT